jgi:hypothetical protein
LVAIAIATSVTSIALAVAPLGAPAVSALAARTVGIAGIP